MKLPDFRNTQIAFRSHDDKSLYKTLNLFRLMNMEWLVGLSSSLGLWAIKLKLPLVKPIIRSTIFKQFCGGESLENSIPTITQLAEYQVKSVMDYGGEAKKSEEEFSATVSEAYNAIIFASAQENVPIISLKISALADIEFLTRIQNTGSTSTEDNTTLKALKERLHTLSAHAESHQVSIFIDAEESWIQDVIDTLVREMQNRYNKEFPTVYNTFQMYRHDRLTYLKECHQHATSHNYILAAKLVRGAYMEKERNRADEKGYPSPIQKNKMATDTDYNLALEFCISQYTTIATFNATHNEDSSLLQASKMIDNNLPLDHPHLNFCQLYGMSDHITFNLAKAGFNAMKYLPYGSIEEVIPYLIRRAQENTSVSGEMGRETKLLYQELQRRKQA